MDPREFSANTVPNPIELPQAPSFRISMTLEITNGQTLWAAAFKAGMAAPGATADDVIDTIGPREDPLLADCLTMLLNPSALSGCAIEHYSIDAHETGQAHCESHGRSSMASTVLTSASGHFCD